MSIKTDLRNVKNLYLEVTAIKPNPTFRVVCGAKEAIISKETMKVIVDMTGGRV